MSYTYLLEQGEEFSAESFSDIPAYVLSKLSLTEGKSCSNDSATECSRNSQSGTTSEPLMESHGEIESISCVEDFRAKESASQEKDSDSTTRVPDCGPKWRGWFARWDHKACSWRTPQPSLFGDSDECSVIWPRWGMMRGGECFPLDTLALPTGVKGFGSLPTPRKSRGWTNCNVSVERKDCITTVILGHPELGMRPHPNFVEWMMGFPIGWTELKPLEMDKFQQWLDSHGKNCQIDLPAKKEDCY